MPPLTSDLDDEVERMAQPGSAFSMPADVHFGDDQAALEARMLLAGYADRLGDAVRGHEPLHIIRDIIARISDLAAVAIAREIRKVLIETNGEPH
jgi:hypothetical protein